MANSIADFVQESTATTGTGAITLTEVAGFARFSDVFVTSDTVYYVIHDANGNKEAGLGTYSATNTLTRTTPQVTYVGSTWDNTSPTAINLSGDAYVKCAITAEQMQSIIDTIPTAGGDSTGEKVYNWMTNQQGGSFTLDMDTGHFWLIEEQLFSTMSITFSNFESAAVSDTTLIPEMHVIIRDGGAKTSVTFPSWINWDNDTTPTAAAMQTSGYDHFVITVLVDSGLIGSGGQYYGFGRWVMSTSGTTRGGGV